MGDKERFIADLYPAARKIGRETGMSWELILAQAAQETGWGQRVLPGTNNIFNIKSHGGWEGESKTFNVWEIEGGRKVWRDQSFRVYDSHEQALRDRVTFLKDNPRYTKAGLFEEGTLGNLEREAAALQKAGYATDPQYARMLSAVFHGPTMQRGIALALGGHQQANDAPREAAMADGVLRQGERGAEVKAMQETLAKLGYRDAQGRELVPDGHFGARTEDALRAFQRDHGLKDDGIAGPKTLDALKIGERQPLISDANHPGNAMYKQALSQLEQLVPQAGFRNQQEMQNAAASLAFEAKVSGMSRIDHVALGTNGQGLFAVQGRLDDPAHHRIYADREAAAQQPVERSSQQWQQDAQQQQSQQAQAQQREPARMSM
ncbi:XVIPCD domain-containing protein [Lysobacter sp.]|uniref:XVIPCD domain-containing protein n=1 Tax=Lysobacter sp. TaxID=72226 RepID=UPI002D30863E|nr:XVIPCD domain-containing protein [Lysobacter sp.]HZX78977.1 XVIPCD domain-containing protein [Lysobacter sp.]